MAESPREIIIEGFSRPPEDPSPGLGTRKSLHLKVPSEVARPLANLLSEFVSVSGSKCIQSVVVFEGKADPNPTLIVTGKEGDKALQKAMVLPREHTRATLSAFDEMFVPFCSTFRPIRVARIT